jgi:GntR family transcriptional repressor for pyruvate dehydrogenase complex
VAEGSELASGAFTESEHLFRTRVPKAAELVAQELRRRIIARELKEGDTLPPEPELIRHFGVSRPTLREAIRILESQDLISVRRGQRSGARVHLPTIEQASFQTALLFQVQDVTLAQIIEAWLFVEPKVIAMLAARRPRDVVSMLRESVGADAPLIDRDVRSPEFQMVGFHRLLIESNGNSALATLLGMLRRIIEKHFQMAIKMRDPSAMYFRYTHALHRDHEELLDYIEEGNDLAAEALWRQHLSIWGSRMVKEFGEDTVVALPV